MASVILPCKETMAIGRRWSSDHGTCVLFRTRFDPRIVDIVESELELPVMTSKSLRILPDREEGHLFAEEGTPC